MRRPNWRTGGPGRNVVRWGRSYPEEAVALVEQVEVARQRNGLALEPPSSLAAVLRRGAWGLVRGRVAVAAAPRRRLPGSASRRSSRSVEPRSSLSALGVGAGAWPVSASASSCGDSPRSSDSPVGCSPRPWRERPFAVPPGTRALGAGSRRVNEGSSGSWPGASPAHQRRAGGPPPSPARPHRRPLGTPRRRDLVCGPSASRTVGGGGFVRRGGGVSSPYGLGPRAPRFDAERIGRRCRPSSTKELASEAEGRGDRRQLLFVLAFEGGALQLGGVHARQHLIRFGVLASGSAGPGKPGDRCSRGTHRRRQAVTTDALGIADRSRSTSGIGWRCAARERSSPAIDDPAMVLTGGQARQPRLLGLLLRRLVAAGPRSVRHVACWACCACRDRPRGPSGTSPAVRRHARWAAASAPTS